MDFGHQENGSSYQKIHQDTPAGYRIVGVQYWLCIN